MYCDFVLLMTEYNTNRTEIINGKQLAEKGISPDRSTNKESFICRFVSLNINKTYCVYDRSLCYHISVLLSTFKF